MHLDQLELRDFRNYARLSLNLSPGVTIVQGPNGAGKTNLLEGACVAATGASPRARSADELVRWGCEYAHLRGGFAGADGRVGVQVGLAAGGQSQIKLNGAARRRVDLVGRIPVVHFWVDDIAIAKGEPGARRRLLDTELSASSRQYYLDLLRYRRAVSQRNQLLKAIRAGREREDALGAWDRAAACYGARLVAARAEFVEQLGPEVQAAHTALTGRERPFVMQYRPSFAAPNAQSDLPRGKSEERLVEELTKALAKVFRCERSADIAQGATGRGPHRDDLELLLGGQSVRAFASQGEQRGCAVAIRVGLATLIRRLAGETPLLLLDDVLSELDAMHRAGVFSACAGVDQLIITCCDGQDVPEDVRRSARVFEVDDGRLV